MTSDNAAPFLAARDFLIAHREDYAAAYADFRWPQLDRFLGLGLFRSDGARQRRTALWLVNEEGRRNQAFLRRVRDARTASLISCARSACAAATACSCMLGNVPPLWETMLAAMKLGAVIIPATTLLSPTICTTGSSAATCAM